MNTKIDYAKIKSIDDVRRLRKRVNRKIEAAEENINYDLEEIRRMFTFDYLLDQLAGKVPKLIPVIQSVYSGYAFISSFINRCRR